MTVGTADLGEERLSSLNILIIEVACGRDGKPAMPNHKVSIVAVRHFRFNVLAHKVVIDVLFHAGRGPSLREIVIELCLHLLVL